MVLTRAITAVAPVMRFIAAGRRSPPPGSLLDKAKKDIVPTKQSEHVMVTGNAERHLGEGSLSPKSSERGNHAEPKVYFGRCANNSEASGIRQQPETKKRLDRSLVPGPGAWCLLGAYSRDETDVAQPFGEGFFRLIDEQGEQPEVIAPNGEDLAIEVLAHHLDRPQKATEDHRLGTRQPFEAVEIDGDSRWAGAASCALLPRPAGESERSAPGRTGQALRLGSERPLYTRSSAPTTAV